MPSSGSLLTSLVAFGAVDTWRERRAPVGDGAAAQRGRSRRPGSFTPSSLSLLTCLVALGAVNAWGQGRTPVLAYWVSHHDVAPALSQPWSETVELPRLVLYDDGLLVKTTPGGPALSVTLSAAEQAQLTAVGGERFEALPDSLEGTREMHPPVHLVTRWSAAGRKTVRFFGSLSTPEHRAKAPPALLEVLDALSRFEHPKLEPYAPQRLLLRACRTKASPGATRWPKAWPAPATGRPMSALDGCFAHEVSAAQRAAAEALVPRGQSYGVLRHGADPWLVTLVRVVLPAEEAWAGR